MGSIELNLMKNAKIFLPHSCSSNQNSISKFLAGIQIFHGKNKGAKNQKEVKASFSNY